MWSFSDNRAGKIYRTLYQLSTYMRVSLVDSDSSQLWLIDSSQWRRKWYSRYTRQQCFIQRNTKLKFGMVAQHPSDEIWAVDKKIVNIISTRCHICRLKCTKINRWGAYNAPLDPRLEQRGPTSKGREGCRKGEREERKVKWREGGKGSWEEESVGKGWLAVPVLVRFWHLWL